MLVRAVAEAGLELSLGTAEEARSRHAHRPAKRLVIIAHPIGVPDAHVQAQVGRRRGEKRALPPWNSPSKTCTAVTV
jgi:hypothetical protein